MSTMQGEAAVDCKCTFKMLGFLKWQVEDYGTRADRLLNGKEHAPSPDAPLIKSALMSSNLIPEQRGTV